MNNTQIIKNAEKMVDRPQTPDYLPDPYEHVSRRWGRIPFSRSPSHKFNWQDWLSEVYGGRENLSEEMGKAEQYGKERDMTAPDYQSFMEEEEYVPIDTRMPTFGEPAMIAGDPDTQGGYTRDPKMEMPRTEEGYWDWHSQLGEEMHPETRQRRQRTHGLDFIGAPAEVFGHELGHYFDFGFDENPHLHSDDTMYREILEELYPEEEDHFSQSMRHADKRTSSRDVPSTHVESAPERAAFLSGLQRFLYNEEGARIESPEDYYNWVEPFDGLQYEEIEALDYPNEVKRLLLQRNYLEKNAPLRKEMLDQRLSRIAPLVVQEQDPYERKYASNN